jgi:hypothetical protein
MEKTEFQSISPGTKIRMLNTFAPEEIGNGSIGKAVMAPIGGLLCVQFGEYDAYCRRDEIEVAQ